MACRATLCVPRWGRAIGRACEQVRNLRDLLVDSPRTTRTRARRSCAQLRVVPPTTTHLLTAQHTLVRIRACHERQYRANVHERVQRVDCVDRAFL